MHTCACACTHKVNKMSKISSISYLMRIIDSSISVCVRVNIKSEKETGAPQCLLSMCSLQSKVISLYPTPSQRSSIIT